MLSINNPVFLLAFVWYSYTIITNISSTITPNITLLTINIPSYHIIISVLLLLAIEYPINILWSSIGPIMLISYYRNIMCYY